MRYLADTAAMPVWTGDEPAPKGVYKWDVYTVLGPYRPTWDQPSTTYAKRRDHEPRHTPQVRWGQLRKWAVTVCREAGEFMVGAFQPIRNAV